MKTFDFLRQHSDSLVGDLKQILATPLPADAELLDFEISWDRGDLFGIRCFPMDIAAGQCGVIFLLHNVSAKVPHDLDEDESGSSLDEAVRWFRDCWKLAGGLDFKHPAYLCQHDDIRSFDLKANKWIDDSMKWC